MAATATSITRVDYPELEEFDARKTISLEDSSPEMSRLGW
jgi:hypothetical protein